MPQAQGGHHHHHEEPALNATVGRGFHEEHEENLDGVWKGLTALGGVYFMFLIEHFLTLGKMYKDKKQKVHTWSPPPLPTFIIETKIQRHFPATKIIKLFIFLLPVNISNT